MMNRGTDDDPIIDRFLAESGEADSEEVRGVLRELRALSVTAAPEPCPELRQFFAPRNVTVMDHRRSRRRTVITTIAVVASMGLGASGVAALSPEFRTTAEEVLSRLVTPAEPAADRTEVAVRESAELPLTEPLTSRTAPASLPEKATQRAKDNYADRMSRPNEVRRGAVAPGKSVSETAKALRPATTPRPANTVRPTQAPARGSSAEVRTVPELPAAVPSDSPAHVRTGIPTDAAIAPDAVIPPAPARGPAPAPPAEQNKPPAPGLEHGRR